MAKTSKVVILHGTYGHPGENWFPWLAKNVQELGQEAVVPAFPTPEGQNLENWLRAFRDQVGEVESHMILVGHSLGAGFALNLLERAKLPVCGTFLVGGFLGELGLEEFDPLIKSFVDREFDWTKVRRNAGRTMVYNSDNDPYVPIEKAKELASKLGTSLIVVKGAGHINASSGYTKFPQILSDLRELWRTRELPK